MKSSLLTTHLLGMAFVANSFSTHLMLIASVHNPSSTLLRSTPNFGDWTNDDFLDSLSGGNDENNAEDYKNHPSQKQQQAPENNLTDEEITEMAVRAAQFYNTDAPIEEVYGVKRKGPPRKQEE